jgi:hypothetical protein
MKFGGTPEYELQKLSAELYNWAGQVERLLSVDPELTKFAALAELADGLDELSRQASTAARCAGYLGNARGALAGLDESKIKESKIKDRPPDK